MNTRFEDKVFRFIVILAFMLGMFGVPNTNAVAQQNLNPFIGVNINGYHPDWVDGLDWTIGELVDITIDDPGTPGSPDAHIAETEVVACEFNPTNGCFRANFNGLYHIKVGDLVTVSQGVITKTHEVLAVEITNLDPVTDIVSGTTDPFIRIRVMAWPSYGPGLATSREVTADELGIGLQTSLMMTRKPMTMIL